MTTTTCYISGRINVNSGQTQVYPRNNTSITFSVGTCCCGCLASRTTNEVWQGQAENSGATRTAGARNSGVAKRELMLETTKQKGAR